MTVVAEVSDAIGMLADLVNNTRSIVRAVTDGREYLHRKFPKAQPNFAAVLDQMQITVEGLASVTGVMARFKFTIGSDEAAEADLRRFNDYLIGQQDLVEELNGNISKLKGNCEQVRTLRDSLDARAQKQAASAMFALLGVANREREQRLAWTVSQFYADDQRMIDTITKMVELANNSLAEVNEQLGPPGQAYAYNVPRAAQLLGVYAELFRQPYGRLRKLADGLREAASELRVE